jgi:hypothetical protein
MGEDRNIPHDVLIFREFANQEGEIQTRSTVVGVAFTNSRGGFNIEIHDGLAITGRAVILPRKPRSSAGDEA